MFGRKKTSTIDRRLDELQREMSKVGTEIKTLARYKMVGADTAAQKTAKSRLAVSDSAPATGAALSSADVKSRAASPDALFPAAPEDGKTNPVFAAGAEGERKGDLPLFENRSPISMTGREKFANYFTAGHFPNLRPSRQERRIIKNKAIIMIILVVLALVWLFFSLYN